jgi:hypothetical protein
VPITVTELIVEFPLTVAAEDRVIAVALTTDAIVVFAGIPAILA